MALIPFEPYKGVERMRNYLDQIFPDSIYPFHFGQTVMPSMDVHETEGEVIATCDIPGLNGKDDVDIDIENNTLSIKGIIKKSNEFDDEEIRHKERFFGGFHRTMTLPCPVNETETKAAYKNGVLEIRMPKLKNTTRNRIDVDFH